MVMRRNGKKELKKGEKMLEKSMVKNERMI